MIGLSHKCQIKLCLFILLNFAAASSPSAQNFPFANYTVEDGLAQSNVVDMVQDKNGNLWLGTESGVSKFDGISFQNYTTSDGLADDNIGAMLLDNKNNIWFGHANGSLTKFDGKKFITIKNDLLPVDKKIYSIFQDNAGKIWISTATKGVVVILNPDGNLADTSNFKAYRGNNGLSEYVFSVLQTKDKRLWFVTDIGVKYCDPEKLEFQFFKAQGLPLMQITSMLEDDNGNLWFGTFSPGESILAKFDVQSKNFSYFGTPAWVRTIKQDREKRIWVATWGGGLMYYDGKKTKKFNSENGLSSNKIYCIFEDRENNIILGTYGNGIAIYKGERFVSFEKNNGLLNDQVWCIYQDKKNGNYWFGTNEGVSMLNYNDKKFSTILETKESIRAIAEDKDKNLWIGTWGNKVLKYDYVNKRKSSVPAIDAITNGLVSTIVVDHKNNVWIGTADGLTCYEQNTGIVKSFRSVDGLAGNDINVIFEDSKGMIWIGCKQKGLTKYFNKTFTNFSKQEGLLHNSPTSITEDANGNIWVGTEGGGVFFYDGNKFSSIKAKDGLSSDFITVVQTDNDNNLWIGTNKGLDKYDPKKKMFYSFGKMEGYYGIETKPNASLKDNKGNLWFGTVNGATMCNLEFFKEHNIKPLTNITRISVNYKEIPITENLQLSYTENTLAFDFVGVYITNPTKVLYQVMLEGADNGWRPPSKQTFDIYSNLPPGHYTFKVRALYDNHNDDNSYSSYSFYIKPPFWRTWWFYISSSVVLVLAVIIYIKSREKQLLKEKRILEEKVAERTAEVVEKNKLLDEINKDITASIRYAKRIQDAILPPNELVKQKLEQSFILFKPKDIVSGDFYWMEATKDIILFAAVDCTGHGVPGAFMSIVGHNLLEQIVGEHKIIQPAEILNSLNRSVSDTLRQSKSDEQNIRMGMDVIKDGMDIALCSLNKNTLELQFAAAFNPLYIISETELIEIKADKFPIGNLQLGEQKLFTNHTIQLKKGDTIYLFSDGFADQFGGPLNKKFKYSSFKQKLMEIQHLSMEKQKDVLNKTLEDWKGIHEQVDDILVLGVRV